MPSSPSATPAIPVARRVNSFSYAIRNIVVEVWKVEAAGGSVRDLNIGDPIAAGFSTPPHLVEAVDRAMRLEQNGYTLSRASSRRARPPPTTSVHAASLSIPIACAHHGYVRGIEITLDALVDPDDEVLVPVPTDPPYTGSSPRSAKSVSTAPIPTMAGGLISITSRADHRSHARAGPGSSQQPDRRGRSARDEARDHRDRRGHGITILSDQVYGDRLRRPGGSRHRMRPMPRLWPTRRCPRCTWRRAGAAAGWPWAAEAARPGAGGHQELADGRPCSPGPGAAR